MSWEIVCLTSIIVTCATAVAIIKLYLTTKADDSLDTRIKVLEENQIVILKVVDEAKKMMSQQNLAQGLSGFAGTVGQRLR